MRGSQQQAVPIGKVQFVAEVAGGMFGYAAVGMLGDTKRGTGTESHWFLWFKCRGEKGQGDAAVQFCNLLL